MPVARRVLGDSHDITLKMRWAYAGALYHDPDATLEDLEGTTRRVLGGAHPVTEAVGTSLREARAALVAREVA